MYRFWYVDTRLYSWLMSQHKPGDDEWGYEDAGERWLPVHTVESVVSGHVPDGLTELTHSSSLSSPSFQPMFLT